MRSLTFLAIALTICGKFEIFSCFENDQRLMEEVLDFVDYLKHKKHEKHTVPESNPKVSVKSRRSEDGADDSEVHDHGEKRSDPDVQSFLEDLVSNHPRRDENVGESEKKLSSKEKLHSNRRKSSSDASTKQHHAVKEIVYIRTSDSDSNDPIPEMIEKIVYDQPAGRTTREVREHSSDTDSSEEQDAESLMQDDANAIPQSEEVCPVRNIASYIDQTCADGPEYEMKFHPQFSEALKSEMLDMLPETDYVEDKCDPKRSLGPETGVEDRALCPFKWTITNRNSSRMPEILYEAKCLCQVPNLISRSNSRRLKCVPVKRAVPVQWLISCENGKKRYKQGWQEIAVACAPVEEIEGDFDGSHSTD